MFSKQQLWFYWRFSHSAPVPEKECKDLWVEHGMHWSCYQSLLININ